MQKTSADALQEEYYQINLDILSSFNKFRPPLNIFRFREDVARVIPYYTVGGRLAKEQIEELHGLVSDGLIFVSRVDHPVYVKHISYQLDLVLVDSNLKETEIADIFAQALTRRMGEFLEQPVKVVFEKLHEDVMVFTEYLHQDLMRSKAFLRRMQKENSLAAHAVNSLFFGINLFRNVAPKQATDGMSRKKLDHVCFGLLLHDMGMCKIPAFVREKSQPLSPDERTKIVNHPRVGADVLGKVDMKFTDIEECVLNHHERLNGKGYPMKKSGDDLGLMSRLCAVVDSYCAMTSERPFKKAMEPMKACAALLTDDGYDPRITQALQVMLVKELKMTF